MMEIICDRRSIPGLSTIQEAISRKTGMSYKKLSVVPSESQTNAQVERCNEYLELTSRMDPSKLHYFDESSVIKTTGKPRRQNFNILGRKKVTD